MDYEKKYKSLVEAVKTLKEANPSDDGIQNWVNDNVPELAESEDEKIRKSLIYHYQGDGCLCTNKYRIDYKEIRAWLEKQGEQKHTPKHKIGDTIYYNSFGEVKSMVVSDVVMDSTDDPMYEDKEGNAVFEKDLIEQKPAWSEEDEEHLERILKELGNQRQRPINSPYLDKIESDYNWLKSLRPQNTWKPSDEQMEALNAINVTGCISYAGQGQELINLYNDLKNLK